ncbi:MAG TPA: hypothetical protein DIT04_13605 [Dysgonomonas sp.]|nr:hypothetical protein [Dysgonomonas sp.]
MKQDARHISFSVYSKDDDLIGFASLVKLDEVVVTGTKTSNKPAKKPTHGILLENPILEDEHLGMGTHVIEWDGFDPDDKLDTSKFAQQITFQIMVSAKIGGRAGYRKTVQTEYMTDDGEWLDVRIDKKANLINTTLRVDFRDGGTKGLSPGSPSMTISTYGINMPGQSADWDKVPAAEQAKIPALRQRNKTHDELVKYAIDGINQYWSRININNQGKDIQVNGVSYQVITEAVDSKERCTDDLSLIFLTNFDWESRFNRSSNPGRVRDWNSFQANFLPQRVFYKAGYYHYKNKITGNTEWDYLSESYSIEDFKETTAHELGHEILAAYGGGEYSNTHKGTSTFYTQSGLPSSILPTSGEVDLMKYYDRPDRSRTIVAEEDIKGLVWLSTIKIKQE